jgi:hypothetical protein
MLQRQRHGKCLQVGRASFFTGNLRTPVFMLSCSDFRALNLYGLCIVNISTYRFILCMQNPDIRLVRDQTLSADVTHSVTGRNVAQFSQGAWWSLIFKLLNS